MPDLSIKEVKPDDPHINEQISDAIRYGTIRMWRVEYTDNVGVYFWQYSKGERFYASRCVNDIGNGRAITGRLSVIMAAKDVLDNYYRSERILQQ